MDQASRGLLLTAAAVGARAAVARAATGLVLTATAVPVAGALLTAAAVGARAAVARAATGLVLTATAVPVAGALLARSRVRAGASHDSLVFLECVWQTTPETPILYLSPLHYCALLAPISVCRAIEGFLLCVKCGLFAR